MAILILKWWREIIALLFFVLWISQVAYTSHLSSKHKNTLAKIESESIKELAKKQDEINRISSDLEAEKQNIKIEFRDIFHESQKIIDRPVYRDCKLDFDGLRIANKAIEATRSAKFTD